MKGGGGMTIDWQGWLYGIKIILSFFVLIIALYIIIRVSSAGVFRSYFDAKNKNRRKKGENEDERS